MSRRKHHLVRNLVIVIVLAVVAYAAVLGVSAAQIYSKSFEARTQFSALSQELASGDVSGAQSTASELEVTVKGIDDQLDWPIWQFAEKIPVLGTEVSTARTLASTATTLVEDALSPVMKDVSKLREDGVIASNGTVDASGVLSNPIDTASLLSSISNAKKVVSSCSETVSSLPTSNIPQLESARKEMVSGLTATNGTLDGYSTKLSTVANAVSSLASSMTGV